MLRQTIIVHNRNAWRTHRTQAAIDAQQGLQLCTMEQLAARLAGGFLQPIDDDALNLALAAALVTPLGDLDAIKALPGFQRAAAATLGQAWTAGLDLTAEMAAASTGTAAARLGSLATLEREVLKHLPANQLRSRNLVAAALEHVRHSRALFGRIAIRGHTEMSPVWRPLLSAMTQATDVAWIADASYIPNWLHSTAVRIEVRASTTPTISAISCASPRHEVLEALRWARQHLTQGTAPQEIAIAAASPEAWDDHMLALGEAANLSIHFAHGRAVLTTSAGQLAAALAETLLRGFSQTRLTRLVGLLRSQNPLFSALPGDWWRALPEDAPLLDGARWQRAIAALTPESFSDGVDHRPRLNQIVETLAKGLHAAAEIGEFLLRAQALAIWRKALAEGPAAALDVTLGGLRVDDGLEPEAAILWAPASTVAAISRPFTWLVGLTSRSWPRRASEDPLLPDHVISATRLDPLPVHQADRRDFQTICNMTGRALVCSRARRDSEGRINGTSPLYPRAVTEVYRAQSREPEHAASATDRLFARDSEFAAQPLARSARSTWIDWHREAVTAHDGRIRANHPLSSAGARSASIRLLVGQAPARSTRVSLDLRLRMVGAHGDRRAAHPRSAGLRQFAPRDSRGSRDADLSVRSRAVLRLRLIDEIVQASVAAGGQVVARWEDTRPIPPPVVWRRKHSEATELDHRSHSRTGKSRLSTNAAGPRFHSVVTGGPRSSLRKPVWRYRGIPCHARRHPRYPHSDRRFDRPTRSLWRPPPCTCHRLQVRHAWKTASTQRRQRTPTLLVCVRGQSAHRRSPRGRSTAPLSSKGRSAPAPRSAGGNA